MSTDRLVVQRPCPKSKGNQEFSECLEVDTAATNFRLQNQRLMITYRTHLNKTEYMDWFRRNFLPNGFLRLAHETADAGHPYEHTHVVVDFGRAFQTRSCRVFDYDDIHPNIKKIMTSNHFTNCKTYLAKEDIENEDLKIKDSIFTQVSNCKDLREVMEMAIKPSDAPGLMVLYDISKQMNVCNPTEIKKLQRWQRQVYEIVKVVPVENEILDPLCGIESDLETCMREWTTVEPIRRTGADRIIHVIHDPLGCSGKTLLCKAMWMYDPNKYFMLQGISNLRDVCTQIENGIKAGWNGHCLFVNITRDCADHKIYTPLEAIRDGILSSQKYSGRTFGFKINHLVIMTNFMPRLTAMSMDRWRIFGLNEYMLLKPIVNNEAMRIYEAESDSRIDNDMAKQVKSTQRVNMRILPAMDGTIQPTWIGI